MKEYFILHYRMLNRKIEEAGIAPVFGYLLGVLLFCGLSFYLFTKTEYAEFLYALIPFSLMSRLSERRRNDFLKTIFDSSRYRKFRMLENLIVATPFIIFLVFKQSFLVALTLAIVAVLMSVINFGNKYYYTIPTPFGKRPYEFPIGFRKTFFFFPIAGFLAFQSIDVDNFNLGLFSIVILAGVVMSYYSKPENEFFIWNYSLSANGFLFHKMKTAILYFTLLSMPIIAALAYFFPSNIYILLLFLLLSYIYIATIILVKYSAYPKEMNLPEGIILAISLIFPPLLIILIPYLYAKSLRKLNVILEND